MTDVKPQPKGCCWLPLRGRKTRICAVIALQWLLILVIGCGKTGPSEPPAPVTPSITDQEAEPRERLLSTYTGFVRVLPFDATVFDVMTDDMDADGHLDLAFTSHGHNYSQVFTRSAPRQFTPGPKIESVGFHPGEMIKLPTDSRRYLMAGEGAKAIKVFQPDQKGSLELLAETPAPFPRAAAVFKWRDWGMGLAMASFKQANVLLFKGFDAETAHFQDAFVVPLKPKLPYEIRLTTADITGDGQEEILFTNRRRSAVMVIRPPEDPELVLETKVLWQFSPPGGAPRWVLPFDINGDHHLDLVVPDETVVPGVRPVTVNILINDGAGAFSLREIKFPSPGEGKGEATGIRAIDIGIDDDQQIYLIAAGYDNLVLMRFPRDWQGDPPNHLSVPLQRTEGMARILLRDLDEDGKLDLVLGRGRGKDAGTLIYGPLWTHFEQLVSEGAVVD